MKRILLRRKLKFYTRIGKSVGFFRKVWIREEIPSSILRLLTPRYSHVSVMLCCKVRIYPINISRRKLWLQCFTHGYAARALYMQIGYDPSSLSLFLFRNGNFDQKSYWTLMENLYRFSSLERSFCAISQFHTPCF